MKDEAGPEDLGRRTKRFALRVIRLYGALPHRAEAQVIGRQVLRSGTSVGAQYREAKRARSVAEFVSKMCSSQQELEETMYWLELLVESGLVPNGQLEPLLDESNQLMAIYATIIRNAKDR